MADDENVYDLDKGEIGAHIVNASRKLPPGAEVLYILGSDWRAIDFVTEIEDTLGIPVLHPVLVRAWYIRRILGLGAPVAGHGRLLAAMPPLPDMAR